MNGARDIRELRLPNSLGDSILGRETGQVPEQTFIQNTAVRRSRLLSLRHNSAEVERRRARVDQSPVASLNAWVRDVRLSPLLPSGAGDTVPWFDPDGGGELAKLLFLMQDPSAVAYGTGFISPDNDDYSARNATVACEAAGLRPDIRVHWNIFPHWVNITKKGKLVDPGRPVQTYRQAQPAAVRFLGELLEARLPNLQVLVLLGKEAQTGWDIFCQGGGHLPSGLEVLRCPSTSPQAWNNKDKATGKRNSDLTIETLRQAQDLLE
jgi:hypothetical protein